MSPARRGQGRSDEPQALGSVLDVLGGERRLAAGLLLGSLGRSWEAVVGERLAEESAPAALDDGVLLVRASSSAWAVQIRFLSREIRDVANRVLAAGGADGGAGGGRSEGSVEAAAAAPIREVRVVVETAPRTP